MKKFVFGRKLSRDYSSRQALFRSLIQALVLHGSIKTTKAKVKAIQGEVDSLVHQAQDTSVASHRKIYAILGNNREITDKLFMVASKFSDIQSGFTRMINVGTRRGDLANMARLEWVKQIEETKKETKTSKVSDKVQEKTEESKNKRSLKVQLPKIGKAATAKKPEKKVTKETVTKKGTTKKKSGK